MPTLEWIGKEKVINHHQEVPFRVLERQYSFDENGQHTEDNGSENTTLILPQRTMRSSKSMWKLAAVCRGLTRWNLPNNDISRSISAACPRKAACASART